jgi:hypothetical protein
VTKDDEIRQLTAVVREADQEFLSVGGSSRHYVIDCLLPALERAGLGLVELTADSVGAPRAG